MKKNVLLILLMATIISACGEAGIQSDISQVVETDPVTVTLDVPAVAIGQLINETPPVTVETGEINITELLETTIVDAHLKTEDVLLFDKAAPGDVNPAAVSVIESALLNGTSFKIELVLVGKNVTFQTASDTFDFLFKFDVTARVQLD